eukprot:snap_masked-scaffold_25-processed-gene-1.23-mRNA-1 protein AED:1.00 eAED:1.00 QI:0/-1/0/0/-1/1/1/0/70
MALEVQNIELRIDKYVTQKKILFQPKIKLYFHTSRCIFVKIYKKSSQSEGKDTLKHKKRILKGEQEKRFR